VLKVSAPNYPHADRQIQSLPSPMKMAKGTGTLQALALATLFVNPYPEPVWLYSLTCF